jgi:hypothetical protein
MALHLISSAATLKVIKPGDARRRISDRGGLSKTDLAALANDSTDYKALIVQAKNTTEKLALAQKLATRRLASGVVPDLDACFAALSLTS